MTVGCSMHWKEKGLEMRVPTLWLQAKRAGSQYLRQKGNLLVEKWRGKSYTLLEFKERGRAAFHPILLQLPRASSARPPLCTPQYIEFSFLEGLTCTSGKKEHSSML